MLDTLATAAGGGLGGLLGQAGGVLSAPRRALWQALGLPDTGEELLNQTFGLEQDTLLSKALGAGAEMALDPLTYAGFLPGHMLGELATGGSGALEAASGEVGELAAARRAAQEGLVDHAAAREAAAAGQEAREPAMRQLDVGGIADAKTKHYRLGTQEARQALEDQGLGQSSPDQAQGLGGVDVLGDRRPPGTLLETRRAGTATGGNAGALGQVLDVNPARQMPSLSPYERYLLMSEAANSGGAQAARSALSDADPLRAMLARRAREEALEVGMPAVDGVPADQGFARAQALLAQAMARKQALEAQQRLTPMEMAAILGAGTGAAALGASAFGQQR